MALDGDTIAGVSGLEEGSAPDKLSTGLTGVMRDYRRRGVALALKVRAASYAREAGFRSISTHNHTTNRVMLSLNEALGFVREPAWIGLKKDLEV